MKEARLAGGWSTVTELENDQLAKIDVSSITVREGSDLTDAIRFIVRRDEADRIRQIGSFPHRDARHIDLRQLVVLQLRHSRPSAREPRLFHEGGLIVPPRVALKVELQLSIR